MNRHLPGVIALLQLLLVLPAFSQEDLTVSTPATPKEPVQIRQLFVFAGLGMSYFLPKKLDNDEEAIAGLNIAGGVGIAWSYESFSVGVIADASLSADPTEQDGRDGAFRTLEFAVRGGLGSVKYGEKGTYWMWGTLGLALPRYHFSSGQTDMIVTTFVPLLGFDFRVFKKGTGVGGRIEYGYPFFLDDEFGKLRKHNIGFQFYIGTAL